MNINDRGEILAVGLNEQGLYLRVPLPTLWILTSETPAGRKIFVEGQTIPGRNYRLESDLNLQTWSGVGTPIVADQDTTTWELEIGSGSLFFRIAGPLPLTRTQESGPASANSQAGKAPAQMIGRRVLSRERAMNPAGPTWEIFQIRELHRQRMSAIDQELGSRCAMLQPSSTWSGRGLVRSHRFKPAPEPGVRETAVAKLSRPASWLIKSGPAVRPNLERNHREKSNNRVESDSTARRFALSDYARGGDNRPGSNRICAASLRHKSDGGLPSIAACSRS